MSDPDHTISTERLSLVWLSPADLTGLLDGNVSGVEASIGTNLPAGWLEEFAGLVGFRSRQVEANPEAAPWLLRLIVRQDPPAVAGLVNFHGPPDDRGFAEVGYSLQPGQRGQGLGVEAVRGLFDWAYRVHGVRRFRASISPDNERSQNLVRKLGMTPVGSQWDDRDGLEVIWTVEGWVPGTG